MRMLLILFGFLFVTSNLALAQQKDLLKTDGYGSLSGKVTLAGNAPVLDPPNLIAKMMMHPDKACCLDKKAPPINFVDTTWVIDKKTRAVANVVVWIKPPAKKALPTHDNFKKRADHVVVDQPYCAYLPRVSAFNPEYFDGKKMVPTGQKFIAKNSAVVGHNVKGTGNPRYNEGFNFNMPPKTEIELTKNMKPQPLPLLLECNFHIWMNAEVYIFDHPYYAITKADGTYSIPFVPAGSEVFIMGHHTAVGYVVNGSKGKAVTFQKNKNITLDFEVTKPGN